MTDALTQHVVGLAQRMGFDHAGVVSAEAEFSPERYTAWIADQHHAGMDYMAEHAELRHHPGELLEGARSILCLTLSYAPRGEWGSDAYIASFARGRNYHKVLKQRCHRLMDAIRETEPSFEGKAFVDSAPLFERRLAVRAGVGFRGRNGCLITEEYGSYVLLAEIVCNLPLTPADPPPMTCQQCGQCQRACPTGAILDRGRIDARLCRSYLTIEPRGDIPPEYWPRMGGCVFGCDVCQQVCPHNVGAGMGDPELSVTAPSLVEISLARILAWTEADWDVATQGTAVRRATYPMLLRNAAIAAGNVGTSEHIVLLDALASHRPELGTIVEWATGQIEARR